MTLMALDFPYTKVLKLLDLRYLQVKFLMSHENKARWRRLKSRAPAVMSHLGEEYQTS